MFCEIFLLFKSFAALIALERPLPCVRLHVLLQIVSLSAIVVALVTLKWSFFSMVPHHVFFHMTICNTNKLAYCASVGLSPEWVFL